MEKCAIIIGINDTPGLPYLESPCSYARRMEQWAKGQGFETRLFTDTADITAEKSDIRLRDIMAAADELLKLNPKQLLVYFAGHGMELEPGNDIWLLPGYQMWPDEAINLTKNRNVVFESGVDHVIFISDACRTVRQRDADRQVLGTSIFPSLHRVNYDVVIDVLYSTWPKQASIDYRDEHGNYISIYSECLLECLHGKVKEVIRYVEDHGEEEAVPVVICPDLSKYLKKTVPVIIKEKTSRHQQPNSFVTSSEPIHVARFNTSELPDDDLKKQIIEEFETEASFPPAETIKDRLDYIKKMPHKFAFKRELGRNIDLIDSVHRSMVNEYSLPSNQTGIVIHGNKYPKIFTLRGNDESLLTDINYRDSFLNEVDVINFIDISNEKELPIIFVSNPRKTGYYPVTLLPFFITNVIFDKNEMISIDYYPTKGYRRMDAIVNRTEIANRKAQIIAAASNGIFQGTEELGSYIRRYKSLDPTLGLFAAYAYFQNGKFEMVRSVYDYMKGESEPVLPEISLLNHLSDRRNESILINRNTILPMLTQGWSYIPLHENWITDRLQNYLRPGLWTSFTPGGMEHIHSIIQPIR